MAATKTTFYLDDALRLRLKALAARAGKTVTELLVEGAQLVLEHHQGAVDRDELQRRAARARADLRAGLYKGPPVADLADELVYAGTKRRRRAG